MRDVISEILNPRTDQGVFFQVGVIIAVWALSAIALRRNRELVYFVTGLAFVALGWRALRAVH